eukprot:4285851-Pyramimonas_sp.AAC.1
MSLRSRVSACRCLHVRVCATLRVPARQRVPRAAAQLWSFCAFCACALARPGRPVHRCASARSRGPACASAPHPACTCRAPHRTQLRNR